MGAHKGGQGRDAKDKLPPPSGGKEEGWPRRKPGDGKGSSGHMCMEQRVTRCRQWVTVNPQAPSAP